MRGDGGERVHLGEQPVAAVRRPLVRVFSTGRIRARWKVGPVPQAVEVDAVVPEGRVIRGMRGVSLG